MKGQSDININNERLDRVMSAKKQQKTLNLIYCVTKRLFNTPMGILLNYQQKKSAFLATTSFLLIPLLYLSVTHKFAGKCYHLPINYYVIKVIYVKISTRKQTESEIQVGHA